MVQQRLGYIIKRAQQALRSRMDTALDDVELTTPQYAALAAVELQPGISNAELARLSFVTPQTMQAIVASLEQQGLIKRSRHPKHGRIQRTELTDKGKKALGLAHSVVVHIQKDMLAEFSPESITRLRQDLRTLTQNLGS